MTYLEIVNKVLKRMRESEVSTVAQSTYSAMAGEYVNDAKKEIEDSWKWGASRSIITVNTVADTTTYSLTGFGQSGQIVSAWNDTQNTNMYPRDQRWFDAQNYTQENVSSTAPYLFCFRGEDSNDDAKIEVYPTPDAAYSLKFNVYTPQAELENDSDVLQIPWRPLVLLSVAMLSEEKGETGGGTNDKKYMTASKSIADAISIDANRYGEELVWRGI